MQRFTRILTNFLKNGEIFLFRPKSPYSAIVLSDLNVLWPSVTGMKVLFHLYVQYVFFHTRKIK